MVDVQLLQRNKNRRESVRNGMFFMVPDPNPRMEPCDVTRVLNFSPISHSEVQNSFLKVLIGLFHRARHVVVVIGFVRSPHSP